MTDRRGIKATMETKKTARRHKRAQFPHQVALRFDEAIYRALDNHADRADRSISDLVRECVPAGIATASAQVSHGEVSGEASKATTRLILTGARPMTGR